MDRDEKTFFLMFPSSGSWIIYWPNRILTWINLSSEEANKRKQIAECEMIRSFFSLAAPHEWICKQASGAGDHNYSCNDSLPPAAFVCALSPSSPCWHEKYFALSRRHCATLCVACDMRERQLRTIQLIVLYPLLNVCWFPVSLSSTPKDQSSAQLLLLFCSSLKCLLCRLYTCSRKKLLFLCWNNCAQKPITE